MPSHGEGTHGGVPGHRNSFSRRLLPNSTFHRSLATTIVNYLPQGSGVLPEEEDVHAGVKRNLSPQEHLQLQQICMLPKMKRTEQQVRSSLGQFGSGLPPCSAVGFLEAACMHAPWASLHACSLGFPPGAHAHDRSAPSLLCACVRRLRRWPSGSPCSRTWTSSPRTS
jgi:hypothetical protein